MINQIKEFEEEMKLEFIDTFLLAGNHNAYFYINTKSNEGLLEAEVRFVYSAVESPVLGLCTIQSMLDVIDVRSEACEIVGIKVYTDRLKHVFLSMEDRMEVSMPLLLDGDQHWIRLSLVYRGEDQIYLGKLSHVHGERLDEKLYNQSYKDGLTGLFNRNTLMLHLSSLSQEYSIYGIMMDIDHFKQINDRYGHDRGDAILVEFGRMLMSLVNEDAIFYRYAGDEFFVQLKCDNDAKAIGFIEKIQAGMKSVQVGGTAITCSIGVAKYESHGNKGEDLLRFADLAMYIAKSKGRNSYHIVSMDEIYEMSPNLLLS